ncbi:hypothetical protein Xbud_03634 [Xenorhabdus budapestensis]|uniref:Uncharacterized protein n=1 Tax=Xenorhabdus budapestensis TaxID=290110 RepID=A0A2D0IN84_XENBU|nr:hypothetical protein Xbud_03634 [Xenorhabdus budapestensis]
MCVVNQCRLSHPADKGFMTDERGTAIDILALVVTFFGFGGVFKTAACVGHMAAKGASHHNVSTSIIRKAPAVLGDGAIITN